VISVAAIIATGVNPEGKREILGLGLGLSEAKEFWVEFLRSLVARGLSGVQWVISDSHVGLKAAIAQVLSATWQQHESCPCGPSGCIGDPYATR
jgi:transposase-like protein